MAAGRLGEQETSPPMHARKMQGCWALMLLVGVVAGAPTRPTLLSYDQVLASAIATYNQQLGSENAFKLLEAEPQPDWDPSAKTIQALRFSIKETVCRADQKADVSQCEEKEDGVDRDCSGFYSADQNPLLITVLCEDMDQELNRITRSRWKRAWRKTKKFVKQHRVTIVSTALRFRG